MREGVRGYPKVKEGQERGNKRTKGTKGRKKKK